MGVANKNDLKTCDLNFVLDWYDEGDTGRP